MKAVCVFCGSSDGVQPEFRAAATALGSFLGGQGIDVVYGGASVGLMGAVADAALGAGGRVYGVIPRHLVDRELAHPGLTALHVTDNMHERKAVMAELSDAFTALPGGFGTLEELAEVTTWAQLGLHHKPIGLLNVAGFYDLFLEHADRMVT
ncbi:MAG TPA: TIGR00730 family Rossman fold protein, partial [Frankiaceae bacterium]|nr:TIGR00730 family Rossman fold protein [Frankiaceae bacterium]